MMFDSRNEKIANTRQKQLGFSLAKSFNEPSLGVFVALVFIASGTAWQNIVGRITAAVYCGDEVVLLQHARVIPQAGRIAAVSTTAVPIVESEFPISVLECRGECLLSSAIGLIASSYFIWVVVAKLLRGFQDFVWMKTSILSRTVVNNLGILLAVAFIGCAFLLPVFFAPTFLAFMYLFWVSSSITFIFNEVALFAAITKTVESVLALAKILRCSEIFGIARRTTLERIRNVEHSLFTSDCLPSRLSANGGKFRLSGSYSLADFSIVAHTD